MQSKQRATNDTDGADALIRVRRLHGVCSHSSLGCLRVRQKDQEPSLLTPLLSSLKIRLLKGIAAALIQRVDSESALCPYTSRNISASIRRYFLLYISIYIYRSRQSCCVQLQCAGWGKEAASLINETLKLNIHCSIIVAKPILYLEID